MGIMDTLIDKVGPLGAILLTLVACVLAFHFVVWMIGFAIKMAFGLLFAAIAIVGGALCGFCALIDKGAHHCLDRRHVLIKWPVFSALFVATFPLRIVGGAMLGIVVDSDRESPENREQIALPAPKERMIETKSR